MGEGSQDSVSVALAGSGGSGVMTAGTMLLAAAARAGYYGMMVRTSGPQIRGGEAAALLRFAAHPVDGLDDTFHALVALDWGNVQRFVDEIPLSASSLVVGEEAEGEAPAGFLASGARPAAVPFRKTAKALAGAWPNMVALGFIGELVGLPAEAVQAAAREALKKADAVEGTRAAVAAGVSMASVLGVRFALPPAPPRAGARWLVSGNEAAGFGAIRGGVRFVAAYPITPATEMLEWMAPALARVGGSLVQAEDELASVNMIVGASYG
ncbi:MAG TPA: 2-oxoacid:acceptor oxidoreductase family protein, partial [Casimicrobiaceae bacterium]